MERKEEIRKAKMRFTYIKKLIENGGNKEYIDYLFCYSKKAIDFVDKLIINHYMMNDYYTLRTIDILLMVDDAKNFEEVRKNLDDEYEEYYADSVYDNFIACLSKKI